MDKIFQGIALAGDVWVLGILVAASIVSLGVIFERWWSFRKNRIDFPAYLTDLTKKLDAGDTAGARQESRRFSSAESRVALAGLTNLSKGAASVQEAMNARLVLERSQLERRLAILATLGNNAPFIGLFGTVLGIIKAFNDLAASGNAGASVVMSGISSALIATAFGIFVAIPAVMANNYFQTRIRRITAHAQSLIHFLVAHLKDEARTSGRREPETIAVP